MSWEYLHLVTHPFPVVLAVTGLAVGMAGWVAGREWLEEWALKAVVLAGASSPVAYYTGIAAADTAARRTFVQPSLVQTHRSWATWAAILLVTTAIFAGFALWQDRGRPEDRRLRRFVLLVAGGAVALSTYAAWLGGGIIHGEARPAPSVDDPAETSEPSSRIRPPGPESADADTPADTSATQTLEHPEWRLALDPTDSLAASWRPSPSPSPSS